MISIVVPIYNKEKYLDKCITSILNQTYKDIEVILINDGSTDSSIEILRKYKENDTRIKIIDKKNEGVSKARNVGIDEASGEYITFIDADDWIDDIYLEKLIENNYDLTICGYKTIRENKVTKSIVFDKKFENKAEIKDQILEKKYINLLVTPYLKLFKLSIIKKNKMKFDEMLQFGEDACFVFNYIKFCNNIKFIPLNMYNNLIVEGTLSRKYINDIYEKGMKLVNLISSYKNEKNFECIEYWYFRNIKLLLYNEKNDKNYVSFYKKINDANIRKIYINNQFSIYDKFLAFLLNQKRYYIIYVIYRYFRQK